MSETDIPEVVCLCGSTRFKDEYRAENRRLTMEGKIVLSVGLFGHADDVEFEEGDKEMLDTLHKRKIDLADRIHVINVDGYVGDSTESEIEYARETDTEITWFERPQYWPETFGKPSLDCTHAFTWDSGDSTYLCMYCEEVREKPPEGAIQAQKEREQ